MEDLLINRFSITRIRSRTDSLSRDLFDILVLSNTHNVAANKTKNTIRKDS